MPLLLALITYLLAAAGAAAGPSEAAPAPPEPGAGSLQSCRDFRNREVRTVEVPGLGDAGRAEFIQGGPVIMLDPALMRTLPSKLQDFFKLHECAHHALGHLFAPSTRSEKEADCWAIHTGRLVDGFTKDDIIAWKPLFAASRGDAFGHLPGPQRVEYLLGCFDEP